jgi:hypothetical protein
MSGLGLCLFLLCACALLALPRRFAAVPLLIGCCYVTMGQGVRIASLSVPFYRMILAVGVIRVIMRKETIGGSLNTIDKCVMAWGAWAMFASLFHHFGPGSGPKYSASLVFDISSCYFLGRIWCHNQKEVSDICKLLAFILVPVALEMAYERATGRNLFSIFGRISEMATVRDGKIRAQGAFRHAILAGTVGAGVFPLMIAIWKPHRTAAAVGAVACLFIVVASASSGPLMSLFFGIAALLFWRWRHLTGLVKKGAILLYILLTIVMTQPAYFIIARLDLTGSSTGYHRARLIDSAIKNIGEWWLFGTDYTRHWMATGVSFSPDHTDITNYYIAFGVAAGLPAVVLLVAMLLTGFKWIGQIQINGGMIEARFFAWCLGAALFSHACTSISVAYFDQSMIFFWWTLAVISSLHNNEAGRYEEREDPFNGYTTH